MRILSLGAGVQSSTLLLMAVHGELQIDAAIFADTGWEPKAVYDWLAFLEGQAAEVGIPVHRVSQGNLRAEALAGNPRAWMPLFVSNLDGSPGMLRRQCTSNFKIVPIKHQLRQMGYGPASPVELVIGISKDEAQRERTSKVRYITNVYPLLDRGLTRDDCKDWIAQHEYPTPPKSSCIGCPYRGQAQWIAMRTEDPEAWEDAVDFDEQIRRIGVKKGEAFLHRQRVPLSEVKLTPQDAGQMDLFGEECEGMCGN